MEKAIQKIGEGPAQGQGLRPEDAGRKEEGDDGEKDDRDPVDDRNHAGGSAEESQPHTVVEDKGYTKGPLRVGEDPKGEGLRRNCEPCRQGKSPDRQRPSTSQNRPIFHGSERSRRRARPKEKTEPWFSFLDAGELVPSVVWP